MATKALLGRVVLWLCDCFAFLINLDLEKTNAERERERERAREGKLLFKTLAMVYIEQI